VKLQPRTLTVVTRALAVAGGLLLVVGAVGVVATGGGDDDTAQATASRSSAAADATAAPSTTTTTVAPTTTTVPLRSRVESFFGDWVRALAAGDEAFLVATLHPAVPERYGDAACVAYLGGITAPAATAEVLDVVDALGPWNWETDGRSTTITDAVTARLRRTEDGSTFIESEVHVALVADDVRWFTDCGAPLEA
jgi:hypothetical protein